tara:strand:+ start:304 stop:948 length:645 start_codon:yes stop_codon:yes gene_type:complete
MIKKNTLVFDFDGTLVDSNHIKYNCFFLSTKNYKEHHAKLNDIISNNINFDRYDTIREFGKQVKISNKEVENLILSYNTLLTKQIYEAKEIKGSSEIINIANKHKMNIYINSATPILELKKTVRHRRIAILDENIFGKPNSKIKNMQEILCKEKDKSHILFVGDGILDKQCAENFKIDFACIRNEENKDWSNKEKFNFSSNLDLVKYMISNNLF